MRKPRIINFAFTSLCIDDKKAMDSLIERSGITLLQSNIKWIEKLKEPKRCDVYFDFNGDERVLNTAGIGGNCPEKAEYKIVFESINHKIYSKNVCKECIKDSMKTTYNRLIRELE